jgi:hypothetical protein
MVATTGIFSRLLHTPQIVSGGSIRTSSNIDLDNDDNDDDQFVAKSGPVF